MSTKDLLDSTLKHRMNSFDTYERQGDTTFVYFYADETNRNDGPMLATVTLRVVAADRYYCCQLYTVKVDMSRALPTRGWRKHAKAIRRAEEFCYLIEGTD